MSKQINDQGLKNKHNWSYIGSLSLDTFFFTKEPNLRYKRKVPEKQLPSNKIP